LRKRFRPPLAPPKEGEKKFDEEKEFSCSVQIEKFEDLNGLKI
jgi:hypothetical protein